MIQRIYHTWEKWECYPAGFYNDTMPAGMSKEQGEEMYREFLGTWERFEAALQGVITTWTHSCEHYLTNEKMNRIAWLGQASMAYAHGIPSMCRGGFNRLSEDEQKAADALALTYLNKWLLARGEQPVNAFDAQSKTAADIY